MRAIWAIYAFLPLCLVPGAVGAYFACPASRSRMTVALVVASLGTFAMCLGLMRWPSIHWALADSYARSGAATQSSIEAIFAGLNLFGNYIGEFLGETCLAAFFLLAGFSMLDEKQFPKWIGWCGVASRHCSSSGRSEMPFSGSARGGCEQCTAAGLDGCPGLVADPVPTTSRARRDERRIDPVSFRFDRVLPWQ